MNYFLNIIKSPTFWTALSAIGTIFVAYLACFPKKEKERVEGWFWAYDNYLRVCIINQSLINISLEKENSLLVTMGSGIELSSEILDERIIIPSKMQRNINYIFSENNMIPIKLGHYEGIYLYTERGTVVKLKQGMNG